MLFGLHPVHTEAITFATASMEIIGLIFAFGSFYLYLSAKRMKSWKFFFSIILAFLAFLTYEMTLILPFLFLLYEICFHKNRQIKKSVFIISPFLIVMALYGFIRLSLDIGTRHNNYLTDNIFLTWVTMVKIFYQYIAVFIFPFNLSVDHTVAKGIGTLKIEKEPFFSQPIVDFGTIITIVCIISLFVLAYKCFKKYPIITFCIGWFFIAMFPVSNIVIPIQQIFAERYLYFASFGLCLLISYALLGQFRPQSFFLRKIVAVRPIIFIVLIISYAMLTMYRNGHWKDNITLWSVTAKQSPYSAVVWNNLGLAYHNAGELDHALKAYQQAVEISTTHARAYNNIGVILYDEKKYDQALKMFKKAASLEPGNLDFASNVAAIEKKLKVSTNDNVASQSSVRKFSRMEYLRQEREFIKKNNISAAIAVLEKALQDYPKDDTFLNDIAVLYLSQGDNVKAEEYLRKAIVIDSASASLHFSLGTALEGQKKKKEAERAYRLALKLDPTFEPAKKALQKLGANNY